MGHKRTHLAAANAAVANRFFNGGAMHNGAYTLLNGGAMPTEGARHVTCAVTQVGADDTMGTLIVVGKGLSGQEVTEVLTPASDASTVTGTKWFRSISTITGADWARDAGAGSEDTIVIGCGADIIAAEGFGELHGVAINTTAAGTITVSDATGTIAVFKASLTEGLYVLDVDYAGFLQVALAAASDVTILHSGSMPSGAY